MNKQIPLNIWNNIERCWVMRLDIVMEGKTIAGIHHTDFENIVGDIDWLIKKLRVYQSEMKSVYDFTQPTKRSTQFTYIYLLKDYKSNYCKIGRSIQPKFREKTLKAENPDCRILFISPLTNLKIEKKLHSLFKEKRIRGEWFNLNNNDVKMIMSYDYGT